MTQPKLNELKQVELPQFDAKPFIGVKAIVDEITIKEKERTENGVVTTSYYVQFKALVDPKGFNGEPLYATRNAGIQMDKDDVPGWGENTAIGKFLKENDVAHPNEMKGKTIIIQKQLNSSYLTF